jgi:heat shock protein HslJ
MSTNQDQKERMNEMKEKFVFYGVFAIVVLFGMVALQSCAPADAVSLEGTSWIVTEINGQPLLDTTEVTMVFEASDVGGNASCNNYFASYETNGDKLTFDTVGMTEMWCMDEGVMDQETLFLHSLPNADTVSIDGNQMTITLKDGGSISLIQQ